MVKGHYIEKIEKELENARSARNAGNEGRARVCARRAAGFAIAWMRNSNGKQVNENDSLNLLRSIETDEVVPAEVRDACKRLTAKVTADFRYPFPTDPIDDARIIIEYVKNLVA